MRAQCSCWVETRCLAGSNKVDSAHGPCVCHLCFTFLKLSRIPKSLCLYDFVNSYLCLLHFKVKQRFKKYLHIHFKTTISPSKANINNTFYGKQVYYPPKWEECIAFCFCKYFWCLKEKDSWISLLYFGEHILRKLVFTYIGGLKVATILVAFSDNCGHYSLKPH